MTTTIKHLDHARHHAGAMDDTAPPDPEVPERSLGRRQFSAKYKAKVLAEYDALPRSARGAMLRREGLYSSLITTWTRQLIQAGQDRREESRELLTTGLHCARLPCAYQQSEDPKLRWTTNWTRHTCI